MISVVIDAPPLSGNPLSPADHGDFLAGRAVLAPLLDTAGLGGCGIVEGTGPGEVRLTVKALRWSDGEPLRGTDLLERFRDPAIPRWAEPATVMLGTDGLTARWPFDPTLLRAMLRLPDWAPRRGSSNPFQPGQPTLGAYCVQSATETEVLLDPNAYWPDSGDPIRLVVEPDPRRGIDLFLEGEVDVTCGTVFTTELVAELGDHPNLVRRASSIHAFVEFGTRGSDINPAGRRRIADILSELDVDRVTQGLLTRSERPLAGRARPRTTQATGDRTLLYANFSPNDEVVAIICHAAEAHGMGLCPLPVTWSEYTARMLTGDFDLAYVLQPDHLDHPLFRVGPWHSACRYATTRRFGSTRVDALIDCALMHGGRDRWDAAEQGLADLVPRIFLGRTTVHVLSRAGGTARHFDPHGIPVLHRLHAGGRR